MIFLNYWKMMKVFECIGIDILKLEVVVFKDYVVSIVEKCNKIVYYNDEVLDLSFNDIIDVID